VSAAALLSIGGSVYGYLRIMRPPDTGELLAVVRDRADKPPRARAASPVAPGTQQPVGEAVEALKKIFR
jgi:hypothetical protein